MSAARWTHDGAEPGRRQAVRVVRRRASIQIDEPRRDIPLNDQPVFADALDSEHRVVDTRGKLVEQSRLPEDNQPIDPSASGKGDRPHENQD